MKVHEDIVERPSGAEGMYGYVEKPHFAAIIALHEGSIQLVRQYRYPIKEQSLELPMGAWTEQPDADPLELAKGELQEETGYVADQIEKIGFHYVDNGGATVGCYVFFATGLTFVGKNLDPEEEDLESLAMPLVEFEQKIVDGDILDACTIASYGLAKLKGLV
jgi:8-oxo-dGTP pyrophosphatase MutT (NUDIX family)